jgi:hypothetical protein
MEKENAPIGATAGPYPSGRIDMYAPDSMDELDITGTAEADG